MDNFFHIFNGFLIEEKLVEKKNQDLDTKKLLFRLPVWLTQMKAENNW